MAGEVWVWVGHVWTDRVELALNHFGDRITDVSIFGWFVDENGNLSQTFDPDNLLQYRAKWPHIRFWLGFRNDGIASIFTALRNNAAARNQLLSDLDDALGAYPWLVGIDIDLEQGGGSENSVAAESLFSSIAGVAHARGLLCAAALPPLTIAGSVGGEDWVRYAQLGEILDHVEIMSYDFAWRGSAPGPISPGFWLESVYDWVTSQIPPHKVSMGLPLYAGFWNIAYYPDDPPGWRGNTGPYYAVSGFFSGHLAIDGTFDNPEGSGNFDRIGWIAYRDPSSQCAWGLLGCYDWRETVDWDRADGVTADEYEDRKFIVRYGLPAAPTLWDVTDNRPGNAHLRYEFEPRRVRRVDGERVGPKNGYTFSVELLQRDPVAATILDDYATSSQQLADVYTHSNWTFWESGNYRQYRGTGDLLFNNSFGSQSLYVQARFQFNTAGRVGVTARGITADVSPSGELRIRRGSAVLATTQVGAIPVGSAAGQDSARAVIALRVRDGSARAYFSRSESWIPRVAEVTLSPGAGAGTAGITSTGTAWVDHIYLGDGWWYQPREAVEIQVRGQSELLGRVPRTGIEWDSAGRFRPTADVDERETRDKTISLDWTYEHWISAPFADDRADRVRLVPTDHDVWVGRMFLVDKDAADIVYWSDAQTIARWSSRARHDWNLAGVALWTLGQEDVRIWDALAGGELSPETKVLNG